MKVNELHEGMMLRAREGLYVYGPAGGSYLSVSKFMSWWSDWQPAENEVIVYLGDHVEEQMLQTRGRPMVPNKALIREVLWRGSVWRVKPTTWRYLVPVEGVGTAKGCDEPSMSMLIADQYLTTAGYG